ncbi:hypothetical protein ACFFLZ_06530 [Photobacterium aphoticum]|uniref:WYL domain-containing protein n=1 Tax=Photobacterium aphoticum TaxID=754436 RepID=A0A090QMI5_9GAMM|nr:hypothetical protein [Photobacterium aphoticum]KLV02016.1 hypothetical protein ABT58_06425 [Photobacterium aphoticum]PSU60261.1 hypothetical protein C9I90_01180 [Photobacterium aphoticum]GAL02984.1 hypothetical protein JCM19237_5877 [Photobacterium aphoticum]GHA34440.1 hypothetical protein GCM10007086_04920 [Photobacterium aphoticum]
MIKALIAAINGRREIHFTYNGLHRVAHPVAIGESDQGDIVLRCYQGEDSFVPSALEWCVCKIEDIRELNLADNVFANDPPGYHKGDIHMRKIYAEL